MADARTEAVKLLGKTFSKGGYSNILLDKTLEKSALDEADKKLCAALLKHSHITRFYYEAIHLLIQ